MRKIANCKVVSANCKVDAGPHPGPLPVGEGGGTADQRPLPAGFRAPTHSVGASGELLTRGIPVDWNGIMHSHALIELAADGPDGGLVSRRLPDLGLSANSQTCRRVLPIIRGSGFVLPSVRIVKI